MPTQCELVLGRTKDLTGAQMYRAELTSAGRLIAMTPWMRRRITVVRMAALAWPTLKIKRVNKAPSEEKSPWE